MREPCGEAVAVCAAEGERLGIAVKLVAFDEATANALREAVARLP